MKTLRLQTLLLFAAVAIFFAACSPESVAPVVDNTVDPRVRTQQDDDPGDQNTGNTIVDLAIATPELSILVDAVIAADLAGVLSSPGNFTVFAPTNDAFLALLDDAGFDSLDDVPVDVLTEILLTHVLGQEFFAADFSTGYFKTLSEGPQSNPTDIFVNTMNGVSINGNVNVVTPNIDASNGVVHLIDRVIAPSEIVTLAVANPNFSSLVAALTRPDLTIDFVGALSAPGPFTVVAPTNAAFQALLDSNPMWNTLADIPAATLEQVLLYHVANGNATSNFFFRRGQISTLQGSFWRTNPVFGSNGLSVQIIGTNSTANIIAVDVQAQNGVIHAIDTVLLP